MLVVLRQANMLYMLVLLPYALAIYLVAMELDTTSQRVTAAFQTP
tara:strand:- start:2229 stop:2363 length:135 start_codon:yes stop_codon:yes gene_type:complete